MPFPTLVAASLAAAATLVALTGCGAERETASPPPPADTTAPATAAADPGTPEWLAELRAEEAALVAAIEQGRLGQVHDLAHRIQSALKAAAQSGTPEQRAALAPHLAAADRLTDQLHRAADAGDLTTTKARLTELRTHLRAIEGVLGVAAP